VLKVQLGNGCCNVFVIHNRFLELEARWFPHVFDFLFKSIFIDCEFWVCE
jgi:hypothetical protein